MEYKYDDNLNQLEELVTYYLEDIATTGSTTKYHTNGLTIEEDYPKEGYKFEYHDNFQRIKYVVINKNNNSESLTIYEYNSNEHRIKETYNSKVTNTYDEYEIDAQKNWTKQTNTDKDGKKEVTTRVITYY